MNALPDEVLKELGQNLDEQGYFVIRDAVSTDRLREFNARTVETYERAPRFVGGGSISGHLNCFPGEDARFIYDEIEELGIASAIRALRPGLPNDVRPT